jgi:hypothetical protein
MKLPSVNLRADLARLSDTELANRLEEQWQIVEAAEARRWWASRWLSLFHSFRGPIRHPAAYRFFAALQGANSGSWLDLLFAVALSTGSTEKFLRKADPVIDAHLSLCEIRDIIDEAERRLAERKERAS